MVKVTTFLFGQPKSCAEYALVALRLTMGGLWLNGVIPRWATVAAGKPLSNPLVGVLFGASNNPTLTLFFTILETLGGIAYVLGLLTRLAAVWGVIEFVVIGGYRLLGGAYDSNLVFLAVQIVLLLYGSFRLSLDGVIAKKSN